MIWKSSAAICAQACECDGVRLHFAADRQLNGCIVLQRGEKRRNVNNSAALCADEMRVGVGVAVIALFSVYVADADNAAGFQQHADVAVHRAEAEVGIFIPELPVNTFSGKMLIGGAYGIQHGLPFDAVSAFCTHKYLNIKNDFW